MSTQTDEELDFIIIGSGFDRRVTRELLRCGQVGACL